MRRLLKAAAAVLAAAGVLCAATAGAQEAKPAPKAPDARVKIRMQTAFNPQISVIGEGGRVFVETVKAMSADQIHIKILESGRVAPSAELLDAVRNGDVDAAFSWPFYAAAREPALMIFASVPFGPSAQEYAAWLYDGDGLKLYRELYARLGVHAIPCGVGGAEAGGWYRTEMKSVADLKGQKLRFSGLGGEVMARFGAEIERVPAGALFNKLSQGKLDGAEFSMPSVDRAIGFEKLTLFYYFPGWHQTASVVDFYMRKELWDSLPSAAQAQMEIACRANVAWMLARIPAEQGRAIDFFRRAGVQMRLWPETMLEAFRATAEDVVREEGEKNADFRAVWSNLQGFLADTRRWQEMQKPRP